jgi:hypothetical protein
LLLFFARGRIGCERRAYCLRAIGGSKEQYDRAQAIFQSDPGANIAAARMMAAMSK